jgi:hypothetical protein
MRQKIDLLRAEIDHLEKARTAGQQEDLTSFDRFVQGYRHTIYDDQLATKKAELEGLLPQLSALEAKNPKAPPVRLPKPKKAPTDRRPIDRRKAAIIGGPLALIVLLGGILVARLGSQSGPALPEPVELAPVTRRPIRERGELFWSREVDFNYKGGAVIISGEPQITGPFWVDDKVVLTVTRPDGSSVVWEKVFNVDCFDNRTAPPQVITELFQPGLNKIKVEMFDLCGADVGTLNKVLLTEM